MKKTYLFAKLGKSIKFNPNSWSGFGGDVELPSLIRSFARNNPDDNIIIIGGTDLDRYEIPEKNVYSIKELYKNKHNINSNKNLGYTYVYDYLKDTKIDGVFIAGGPVGSTNLPNTSFVRKTWEQEGKKIYAKVLETYLNYAAPIIYFLNNTKVPWIHILNDPRYKTIGRDCLNIPEICLSQYNEEIQYRVLNNFEEQDIVIHKRKGIYSKIETMFLTHYGKFNFDLSLLENINKLLEFKSEKFAIILNEGNNGVKSRYDDLKKYVLDHNDNVDIFGKWSEKITKSDKRFKGTIKYNELQNVLKKMKYTFIIPIAPGWVTMKFWEMVHNGVIPFMSPEYDSQNNLDLPDFLKIKDAQDLKNKIDILEKNPDKYTKLLKFLVNKINDDMFTGKELSDLLLKHNSNYKNKFDDFNVSKKELELKSLSNIEDEW